MRRMFSLLLCLTLLLPLGLVSAQDDDDKQVFRWDEYGLSFIYPAAWGERIDADQFLVISPDPDLLDSLTDPEALALIIAVLPPDIEVFTNPNAPLLPTEEPTEPSVTPQATIAPDATISPEETATPIEFDPLGDFETFVLANEFFGPELAPRSVVVNNTMNGYVGIALAPEDDPTHQQVAVITDFQLTFLFRLYDPNNEVTPEAFAEMLDTVILSGLAVPVSTPEPIPPFAADAAPISAGEPIVAEMDEETDSIFYSFTATPGQFATIAMVAEDDVELDTTLYLYADDLEIAYNDDGILGTLNARIVNIELPEASRYVIEASKFDGAGTFTLTLTLSDTGSIDTIIEDSEPSGELFYGDRITDSFARSTQTRYYTFTGAAGDEILILMEATTNEGLDPVLTLYSANGETVASNDDIAPGNYDSQIEVVLVEDGTYYIVASSFFGSGAYDLLLERN